VPAALFEAPGVAAGLVAQLVFWSGQASFFLVLALYLQQGRGLSAPHSGLVFTILAGAYLAASVPAPALTAFCRKSPGAVQFPRPARPTRVRTLWRDRFVPDPISACGSGRYWSWDERLGPDPGGRPGSGTNWPLQQAEGSAEGGRDLA
jgi:hypothetical protein